MTEDGSCKSGDDTAAQLDCEFESWRVGYFGFGLFGYISKDDLMAEFVYSKLANCVRYLSVRRGVGLVGCKGAWVGTQTYLQRMGRKPAYSSRTPPSLAKRVNPETRPVAYPR